MPTKKQDIEAQARKIALEVGHRRKAGEIITDEQILRDHPNLHAPLLEQLTRLNRLETARLRVEQELSVSAEATEVNLESSDALELTSEAPRELADSTDQLRITLREPGEAVQNRSTMVVADSAQVESTSSETDIPNYRPTVRAPMAVVKLFHDGQKSFNHYPVMSDRFRIGRMDGDLIVPHDFWMSGRHAEIQRRKRGGQYHWFLVDLNSTNGTFVQADFAVLHHHDELFLGQERYRFTDQGGRAGLMHVTTGAGQQWWLPDSAAAIGSQPPCGLRAFAADPFLDPVHAHLKRQPDGTWTIRDNGSHNGVWYRVKEVEIPAYAEFQLGEQRFGFWAHTDHPVKSVHLQVAVKAKS